MTQGEKSPKLQAMNEIRVLGQEVHNEVIVNLRGHIWLSSDTGLSRKIDPSGDWRVSNSQGLPLGWLTPDEVFRVRHAWRAAREAEVTGRTPQVANDGQSTP
jgi:hypothetical protein